MKNFSLLLVLHLICNHGRIAVAQIAPSQTTLGRITSASPEASSIALYQNYPVDYVSGVPNIEIPLFDVPTRAGVIPFKLSYHVGKLKPSEQVGGPGWGWTVSPNLGITRAVKGGQDGVGSGYPANSSFGQTDDNYFLGASLYTLDEQPDDFYYSLLSKGGQFIYNRKGGFTQVSYEAVKISHPDNNTFVITDDDGTIYKFGKYSSGSGVVTEFAGTTSSTALTAWKITEIIPYDKSDSIQFIYGTRVTNTMQYYNIQWQLIEFLDVWDPIGGGNTKPVNIYHNVYNIGQGIVTGAQVMRPTSAQTGPYYPTEPFDFMLPLIPEGEYKITLTNATPGSIREQTAWNGLDYGTDHIAEVMSDNNTDELPLTEIRFKGGSVVFNYTGNLLNAVSLYSQNKLVKKARLYQHILHHADNEQPFPYYDNLNNRYGLDAVKISGSDTTSSMTYKMEYAVQNGEECVGVYGNYNTDFWGFLNGKRSAIVPHVMYHVTNFVWNSLLENTDYTNLNGAPKNAGGWANIGNSQENTSSSRIVPGIIKRLYYPTGGYAEFDFENNEYQSSNDYTRIVYGGGYRVKQIKYTTGDKRDSIVKVYKYGIGEDGVGKTKYKNYSQNFISVQLINSTRAGNANNFLQKIATINPKPFLDMSFASGAAVLYPQVTEYMINPANNQPLGKTVYNYNIDSKNDAWVDMTPLQADARTDWKIISHLSTAIYRYNSGNYNIINKTTNSYRDYYMDTVPAAQTFLKYYNAVSNGPGLDIIAANPPGSSVFAHISYNIYAGAHKLTEVRDTLFNADNPLQYLATTTAIEYDSTHLYQSRESKTDSKGVLRKTELLYPHQGSKITDLITGQQTLLTSLESANRINQAVETKEYSQGTLLQTVQRNFAQYPNAKVFPSAVYASMLNNNLEKKIELGLYDSYGNILEQQKANDVKEVYLWGYRSQYPVAKVLGSTFSIVQGFISQVLLDSAHNYTDEQIRTELAKIRTGLAGTNAQVLTYTYKPMTGMTSETDVTGRTTYYEYDSFGRLSLIKDHNGNILKMYCYNYAGEPEDCGPKPPTIYYNTITTGNFTRNNCGTGYNGSKVTYSIPSGTYTSLMSMAAANQLAQNDVNANGQTYANTHGTCLVSSLSIAYRNYGTGISAPITFTFTNTSTGLQYVRSTTPSISSGTLGSVPEGSYNVQITNANGGSHYYTVGCYYSISGNAPLTISNAYIGQTCPMVTIDND